MTTDKQLLNLVKFHIQLFLSKGEDLFSNENDFRHRLALFLDKSGLYDKIHLEYKVPGETDEKWCYIDIVVEKGGFFVPIELKYKRKRIKGTFKRFGIECKDMELIAEDGAQHDNRYFFWHDVERIETWASKYNCISGGIAVFLTNDNTYETSKNSKCSMVESDQARPDDNEMTVRKKSVKIVLDQTYGIHWYAANINPIEGVNDNQPTEFRYCMVCCERNYTPVKNSSLLTYIPKK